MMAKTFILHLPDDIYSTISANGYYGEKLGREIKKYLAAGLFKKKVLSLGKSAEVAQINIWGFIDFLGELGIPVADYDEDEINREIKNSRNVIKKINKLK